MKRAGAVLTADVGGTKIRTAIVSANSRVRRVRVIPTPSPSQKKRVVPTLTALLRTYEPRTYGKIGIGFAGLTTWPSGRVITAPSLPGMEGFSLRSVIQRGLKKPTVVDNDATLWTYGEALLGAGRRARTVLGLILGTGVGGGFVVDGNIYRGRHNASEFGHMVVHDRGLRDQHGGAGHLEAYCGGWGIEQQYFRASHHRLSGQEISTAARRNDSLARSVIRNAANYLAIGIANLLHLFDPDVLMLGGNIAKLHGLLPEMRRRLPGYLLHRVFSSTRIVNPELGDDAPLIGAALLARDNR